MYSIRIDSQQGVIDVALTGMMSVDEVADYVRDLRREIVAHRMRAYAMVIDLTDCPIQSQDVIGAIGRHMADMPKALALVTGSSLARMQVRRLFTQPYARVVATRAEGWAWVTAGVEPATVVVQRQAG